MDAFGGREVVHDVVVAEPLQERPPILARVRSSTGQSGGLKNQTNMYLVLAPIHDRAGGWLCKYVAILEGFDRPVDRTRHAECSSVGLVQCACRDTAIILTYRGL